jgi:hypothetical protein
MRAVVPWLLTSLLSATALGDTCKEAFTESSKLASEGRLLDARSQLRACASEACPAAMRPLCTHDLEALQPRVPTIVLSAKDGVTHQDLLDVQVLLDGKLIQDGLDGKARDVDPGPHVLRFERAGTVLSEQHLLIREGEKDRVIAVDAQPTSAAAAERWRPLPWSVWLTGGLAIATGAVWAVTGITGFAKESQLGSCKAMGCPPSSVQSTERMVNVADVAGGTTLALGALTAILVFTRPAVARGPSASLAWTGHGLAFSGTF